MDSSYDSGPGDYSYAESDSFHESDVVPSDAGSDVDLVKGLAQRATEPFIKERRAQGEFVQVRRPGKTGRSYYTKEDRFQKIIEEKDWVTDKTLNKLRPKDKATQEIYDRDLASSDEEPAPKTKEEKPERKASGQPSGSSSSRAPRKETVPKREEEMADDSGHSEKDEVAVPRGGSRPASRTSSRPGSRPSSRPASRQASRQASPARSASDAEDVEDDGAPIEPPLLDDGSEVEVPLPPRGQSLSRSGSRSRASDRRDRDRDRRDSDRSENVRSSREGRGRDYSDRDRDRDRGRDRDRDLPPRDRSRGRGGRSERSGPPPPPLPPVDPYASEANSMSSGLEPNEYREATARQGRLLRPFKENEFLEQLAHATEQTMTANRMRRNGLAPGNCGIADDLPTKLVYENLLSLKGMSAKVQEVINHNETIFANRLAQEEKALRQKVWDSWRDRVQNKAVLLARIKKSANKIMRGTMARCFYAWRDEYHLTDNSYLMKKKLDATIKRGLLKRTFGAWWKSVEETRFNAVVEANQLAARAMDRYNQRIRDRAVLVMQRRRLAPLFYAWKNETEEELRRHRQMQAVAARFLNGTVAKAFSRWKEYTEERKDKKRVARYAINRITQGLKTRAFDKWLSMVGTRKDEEQAMKRAIGHWQNRQMASAWEQWAYECQRRREKIQALTMWKRRAFNNWADNAAEQARENRLMERCGGRANAKLLKKFFLGWCEAMEQKEEEKEQEEVQQLQEDFSQLQAENTRLQRDCERFQRIIDSGEWGRGRVEELARAGEVMRGERDAMLKLITVLRNEYDQLHEAKENQEAEIKALKDKFLQSGHSRNMMLVRGGSSFNGMVRAMKQSLVDENNTGPGTGGGGPGPGPGPSAPPRPSTGSRRNSGAGDQNPYGGPMSTYDAIDRAQMQAGRSRLVEGSVPRVRDPALLYEVDRLSLDRVAVYPDGDLSIKAVPGAERAPIRPTSSQLQEPRGRSGSAPRPVRYPPGMGPPSRR